MSNHKNFSSIDHLVGNNISKEHKQTSSKERVFKMHEVVDREPSEEVKEFIQSSQERVKVLSDLRKAGVAYKVEAPRYADTHTIVLPLSDEMVVKGLHAPIASSFRWLAEWAQYLLKKAHIILKKVHGHVKRIIQ